MKIWLITDTHFGHDKMEIYCDRPKDFSKRIVKGLEVVEPNDILIHLGDFCIGNDEVWHRQFHQEIAGKHWLVKGNHDNKSNSWYLRNGWDWVGAKFQDKFFGKNILFSHTPQMEDKQIESGLWISGSFDLNIHGHYHNNNHRSKDEQVEITKKHKLLAMEFTNYQPVLLENFIKAK